MLEAVNPCQDEAAFLSWRVKRRIGAVGLLWNRRSDAFIGIDMNNEQRAEAFDSLEKEGKILPIQVEGIRSFLYMLSEDLPIMETVLKEKADLKPRLEFLAPLDPMLWDRRLIEALWNYHYSWEIYTPAAKRKYGYYVLPMVFGQELIGRIEAAADRKTNTLAVKNIWFEPGVRQTKTLMIALDKTIQRLARFNDCELVSREEKHDEP